ncbi:MAG TPA: hypothetical protein VEK15_02090 [Vicinamibacteria bacterium]|nr:hypothetical protein [Vicinamibacteria bacterium]
MSFRSAIDSLIVIGLCAAVGYAQEEQEKIDESYRAFGVAMGPGMTGVLDIHISRWSTDEERQALVESLIQNGQEKTVDLLRKQKETGWTRTQAGRGMRGWPSVRLHYAYQFSQPDGKRVVVLVTDRNIGMAEAVRSGRSTEYEVSGIVMELQKGEDGKEKGQGTLFMAVKLNFDEEKKQLEIESLGVEPVRLTKIAREK